MAVPERDDPSVVGRLLAEVLGYLNFSSGQPDPAFQRNLSLLEAAAGCCTDGTLPQRLLTHLRELQQTSPAFADSHQAEQVITLVAESVLPAYRAAQADLLFHLSPADFRQPFLLARMFEATLSHCAQSLDREQVATAVVESLNDFLGYRPVAVLENGRLSQAWPNEFHRPVPLWLRGAGTAAGPYEPLIERTMALLHSTPPAVLRMAWFDPDRLDELALDMRAHDHLHPANKRTNYMFGEWDPSLIDRSGFYRRFIVRRIILDALLRWIAQAEHIPPAEALEDAASVLCGTILMASAISGEGPTTFDSSVTLSSLLPQVARQRDEFYGRLLAEARGARAQRLRNEARQTQQPFGHVRQMLNLDLAAFGARQLQMRHLAALFARMGFRDEARRRAAAIPAPAARFECEVLWRLTSAGQALAAGKLEDGWTLLQESRALLERGIECGAFVDPWNILGFQAQFPLFTSREDSVADQRVETLLGIMEQFFSCASQALIESAARGQHEMRDRFAAWFSSLAEWWDRFATATVEDVPRVVGQESRESAGHAATALAAWQAAGRAAGDIGFWREYSSAFQSPLAYGRVVSSLLDRGDRIASLGLMMQWLSNAEDIGLGLEAGVLSIHSLLRRWSRETGNDGRTSVAWKETRRLFELLEANGGPYWEAPTLAGSLGEIPLIREEPAASHWDDPDLDSDDLGDEADDTLEAAWDGVVYRDSTDDGTDSDTLDDGYSSGSSDLDLIARNLEPRLRFLSTLAELWQHAASRFTTLPAPASPRDAISRDEWSSTLGSWRDRARHLQAELAQLIRQLQQHDIGGTSGEFSENLEFDVQLQMRLYLLHRLISTIVHLRDAERFLDCCLSSQSDSQTGTAPTEGVDSGTIVVEVYRAMFLRDVVAVRRAFPRLLKYLRRLPLLYVSLENGGDPLDVMRIRFRQRKIRFLLSQLPQLGLFRETAQLLETAFQMERRSRPDGVAVTEFDQLFRIALESSLSCIARSSGRWQRDGVRARQATASSFAIHRADTAPAAPPCRRVSHFARRGTSAHSNRSARRAGGGHGSSRARRLNTRTAVFAGERAKRRNSSRELLDLFAEFVGRFEHQWLRHSRTVRLSGAEELRPARVWNGVEEFIRKYGAELFHPRMLTLGNVRAILHQGVVEFLDHLEDNRDPLHPVPLLEAIAASDISFEEAVETLELIYGVIVDRFDRYFEYNTTTTHSDYGEKLYCLLDFLRVEAACERDAWNLLPSGIAHEVLTRAGRTVEARIWEQHVEETTRARAARHAAALRRVEQKHGMQLPAVRDHLDGRFVRPLAINRMLALIPLAIEQQRRGRSSSPAFAQLQKQIDECLRKACGSGVDVPDWLGRMEQEVHRLELGDDGNDLEDSGIRLPAPVIRPGQIRRELRLWPQGRSASG